MKRNKAPYKSPKLKKKKIQLAQFYSQRFTDSMDDLLGIEVLAQSGGSACTSCLPADMNIRLTNNQNQQIAQMNTGDTILSWNTKANKSVKGKIKKIYIHKNYSKGLFIINNGLKITPNHLIYSKEKGWIPVAYLKIGDFLIDYRGDYSLVTSVKMIRDTCDVYNIEVNNNDHNYFAQSYLVHNKP